MKKFVKLVIFKNLFPRINRMDLIYKEDVALQHICVSAFVLTAYKTVVC